MNDADAAKRSVSYFTEGNFFYALTPSPVNVEPSDTGLFEDRRGADDRLGAIPCPCEKNGQRMGRKPKLTEEQQAEARKRRAEGATLTELARSYGVGKSTISRLKA
jgi:hypothetical protein